MSHRKRYTLREFKRGVARCRLKKESIAIARSVLVEGEPPILVAKTHKVTRQWVSLAVQKMRKYIEDANPVPPGWSADVVTLPESVWPKVRVIERDARAQLRGGRIAK